MLTARYAARTSRVNPKLGRSGSPTMSTSVNILALRDATNVLPLESEREGVFERIPPKSAKKRQRELNLEKVREEKRRRSAGERLSRASKEDDVDDIGRPPRRQYS